jgi:toxin ParE1/3/4
MTPSYIVNEVAEREIAEIAERFAELEGEDLALRFVDAVNETIQFIAEFPGLGSLFQSRFKSLQDIRQRPITGFPNHIIYYRESSENVVILHVLHGARRVSRILRDDS